MGTTIKVLVPKEIRKRLNKYEVRQAIIELLRYDDRSAYHLEDTAGISADHTLTANDFPDTEEELENIKEIVKEYPEDREYLLEELEKAINRARLKSAMQETDAIIVTDYEYYEHEDKYRDRTPVSELVFGNHTT